MRNKAGEHESMGACGHAIRACLFLMVLMTVAHPAIAQRTERRVGVPAGATITVVNHSGSIEVVGSSTDEISIPQARDLQRELEIQVDGRQIRVEVRTMHLLVRVPSNARLNVRGESGSVTVSGVTAPVDIETSSSSIDVNGIPETLHIETLSGSIQADGDRESLYAETVSGSVTINQARGVVDARSTSGHVNVRGRELKEARLSSVSGQVSFEGTFSRDGRLEAESSSGHIELRMPESFGAEYDLTAISGSIDNEFGPRPARSRNGSGEHLKFVSSGGGGRVIATTVSGSIRLQNP